jgi:hypothetical protein
MIISTTTIIAGAVVVLLAVLGSLINPFLRSLRFQKTETAENQPPVSILITAHDNLAELERNLPMFLRQQYTADYQVIVVCQSTDGETQDFLKRTAAENPHLYYTYIPTVFSVFSCRNSHKQRNIIVENFIYSIYNF